MSKIKFYVIALLKEKNEGEPGGAWWITLSP